MLFEIVLFVRQRMAGRMRVGDGEILSVVENGVKRNPKSTSLDAALKYLKDNTDLEPVGHPLLVDSRGTVIWRTHKYTFRPDGVYVQSQYGKWAVAYQKEDGSWWVRKVLNVDRKPPEIETRFANKSMAMADVDAHVGYDYVKDLHIQTVDKNHETRRN